MLEERYLFHSSNDIGITVAQHQTQSGVLVVFEQKIGNNLEQEMPENKELTCRVNLMLFSLSHTHFLSLSLFLSLFTAHAYLCQNFCSFVHIKLKRACGEGGKRKCSIPVPANLFFDLFDIVLVASGWGHCRDVVLLYGFRNRSGGNGRRGCGSGNLVC